MTTKLRLPNVPKDVNRDMTVLLTAIKEAIEYMSAHGTGADNTSKGYFEKLNKKTVNDLNTDFGSTLDDALGVGNLLNILNGRITESQLFKDLGEKIAKINVTETDLNLAKIELDNAKAGVGELNEAVFTEAGVVARNKLELRAEFDSALNGDSPNSVKNLIEKNTAAIDNESTVRAGELDAYAETVNTLQTTVNGHTSSIEEIKNSSNGTYASWGIRADVNGLVGGIGFGNDGETVDFIVRASTFAVAGPSGSSSTPFTVVNTPMTINGVAVPVGTYMTSAYIMNGTITSAKIGNAQVDTLQIKGEAVIVPRIDFNPYNFDFYTIDTEEVINSVTINAAGGGVTINFGFEKLYARSRGRETSELDGKIYLRIKRGSTVLRTMRLEKTGSRYNERQVGGTGNTYMEYDYTIWNMDYRNFATILDIPPSGEHTYTVTLESRGLNPGLSVNDQAPYPVTVAARSLHIIGAKR